MAKHSFIVTLETSDTGKESVKTQLSNVIKDWLDNLHFITKQPEELESVSIITKVEKVAILPVKKGQVYAVKETSTYFIIENVHEDTTVDIINDKGEHKIVTIDLIKEALKKEEIYLKL